MAIDLLNSNTVVLSEVCGWKKVDHFYEGNVLNIKPSQVIIKKTSLNGKSIKNIEVSFYIEMQLQDYTVFLTLII